MKQEASEIMKAAMNRPSKPYDFSDWELGEDALADVELAVYEIIDSARSSGTGNAVEPDFGKLHDAVIGLVRAQLMFAFEESRAGYWTINPSEGARLRWVSRMDEMDDSAAIQVRPGQLTPLFLGGLIERLDEQEHRRDVEQEDQEDQKDELDWAQTWDLTFRAVTEWRRSVLATLRGLKAIRAERRERMSAQTITRDVPEAAAL